jgi:hypothetical protein
VYASFTARLGTLTRPYLCSRTKPFSPFAAPSSRGERRGAGSFRAFSSSAFEKDSETEFHALAHELTDLLYVTYGAPIAFGVEPDRVFAEVHRANMQKVAGPSVRTASS